MRQTPGTYTESVPWTDMPDTFMYPRAVTLAFTRRVHRNAIGRLERMKSSATRGATGDEREEKQGVHLLGGVPAKTLSFLTAVCSDSSSFDRTTHIETSPACLPARPLLAQPIKRANYTQHYTKHTG